MAETDDPYQWLEDLDSAEVLAWVRDRSDRTVAALAGPDFDDTVAAIRGVLDSPAKIPQCVARGQWLYNFWTDADHPRGLWRRTTMASYRSEQPVWHTIVDVDALNAAENADWVWHGANVLRPSFDRALIDVSHGGADADVTREFDIEERRWVADGFVRPEAKGSVAWIDRDTTFVCTDVGPGSMTASGYPRIAKRWSRGTSLTSAPEVFAGEASDLAVQAMHDPTPGFERDLVVRARSFYRSEVFLLGDNDALVRIDVPETAEISVHRQWLLVELRDDWSIGADGPRYSVGSLLAIRLADFVAGGRDLDVLYEPDDSSALSSLVWTANHLVLTTLVDVRHEVTVLTPPTDDGGWRRCRLGGFPEASTVGVRAYDSIDSDVVWVTTTGFLRPTVLSLLDVGATVEQAADAGPVKQAGTIGQAADAGASVPEVSRHQVGDVRAELTFLKTTPRFFDDAGMAAEQRFATSADGTAVPYFVVSSRPGTCGPTLLYGYGGFEVSMLPAYSGSLGRAWLAHGGRYVVANIRGGGEYGPRWHQAALGPDRHRAYEDFAAVARDLVACGDTTVDQLGAFGGSNGGLLIGNMLVSYPELFGALVIEVPLLDMRRYTRLSAGASWIAEYGDPDDPHQWEWIRTFSPYQLVSPGRRYPPVLLTTSTRDDRVHPGHARKMAAKLEEFGADVLYYENTEGGHGGAADNKQAAFMSALMYTFFWRQLARG